MLTAFSYRLSQKDTFNTVYNGDIFADLIYGSKNRRNIIIMLCNKNNEREV